MPVKKRYGENLDEVKKKLDAAREETVKYRRKVDKDNAHRLWSPMFPKRHKRQLWKADKKEAELESAYNNLKKHDDQVKEVKDTFDKLKDMPKGPEREAAANKMMAYIRDDPDGDAGNEAASRLHVELANKAYDAFGDYDFDKDKYANCKTPSVRKADKAYMDAKKELNTYHDTVHDNAIKNARDSKTGRIDYKVVDKALDALKSDPKYKALEEARKNTKNTFIEECLKAIGFPVTPENMETIWPFLYGS